MTDPATDAPDPRPGRPTTVERAFELAGLGDCRDLNELTAMLKREQYEAVDAHLAGPAIRQALRQLCAEARARRTGC
jgi:hypothetical protein